MQLDRVRAAGIQPFSASTITAGDEPLIVDLPLPAFPGKHWIVEVVSFVSKLSVRGPSTAASFPPITGLYLCPPGTVAESLADAVAGANMNARPVLLPMGPPGANVATIGAGAFPFAFALTAALGYKFTVPYSWFLRAIVVCQAGNAAPGPGAASTGVLTAMAVQENDNDSAIECR